MSSRLVGLIGLLINYWGALEADLQRYYQVDLVDFWRGSLSLRRIGQLVAHLPPGAAIHRTLDSSQAWTEEAHFAALSFDALRVLAWQKTKDGSKGRNAPRPTPRPGVASSSDLEENQRRWGSKSDAVSIEEMREWLGL